MTTYKNIRRIGGGTFGDVYECETADKKVFAKKVLKSTDLEDIARFLKEVRILSTLDHPNIVKVTAKYLTGAPYSFVMPRYKSSLEDCFPGIVSDEARIIPIFTAILNAIEYAHKQGIIHRDLKPSNVLLNSDTDVAVTDFGLGRITADNTARLTKSNQGFGTPGYASPEQWDQCNAKYADGRSDIYTLGKILYELYAGLLQNGVHPDLNLLSPKIRLVVDGCLKQKPEERYQSLEELKRTWLAITGQVDEALTKLNELAAELCTPRIADDKLLDQFIELLAQHDTNLDAVQEALLTASYKIVAQMYKKNAGFTGALIGKFIDHAKSQQWPSDHSHQLACFCDDLCGQIGDIEIRSKLLAAMMHLAKQSGLFKTQKLIRKRLLGAMDAAASQGVENHIKALSADVAQHTYIQVAHLDQLALSLRVAFELAILGAVTHTAFTMDHWDQFIAGLTTRDKNLADKLQECTHGPELRSRTLLIRMKNAPVDKLSYQVSLLETLWAEIVGHRSVIILMP